MKLCMEKSFLNICIQLGDTSVLEYYPRRLSEKRVLVGPDFVDVILNYSKAGRVVCEAEAL